MGYYGGREVIKLGGRGMDLGGVMQSNMLYEVLKKLIKVVFKILYLY